MGYTVTSEKDSHVNGSEISENETSTILSTYHKDVWLQNK